ncbi:BREX-1 system adenine-specific DNA-methyltransferase PglX [Duganella sp. FT27W]|uniref:BREX-1 system adenine-specific DNA-methyltransferase PglX n=1 Tax=Duganella sp. FT27W TaxID=2654636 RepID=UPI001D0380AB|nr:BREX-1 system adenine-specific DNA-methyltransferase PglX [Duganella sp. FT27W]
MAFDQSTRGRLQKLVDSCRSLLSDEFSIQLQQTYGLDPKTGGVTPMARLTHLDDRQRHTAEVLRQTLAHYLGADVNDTDHRIAVLDRMVREQAFTVLNRLAALLMMESRGQLIESVSKGYQSRGYQLYSKIAGTALGETGQAYQVYLFSVFDELAQELPALFDRYAANGLLFPRETALRALLDQLNHFEIEQLWAEDETIGWIYQYFNSPEERKAMRKARAPRTSRELAVRNQFFTPRYVVEFLVDNTLGRLWFNATGGETDLRDRCQYLLIKSDEQPQAAIKLRDPRTLKLLDPACGSMHFGLYAFDLFAEIYREAWSWEQQCGPGSLDVSTQPQAALKPLCQTYEDQAAFLRDVPRLIIENNIYGVDIDPRAAQIATLALWLRAQRAWHDADVKAKDRPCIAHGHVVAAVAPPAERELRQLFAKQLDPLDADLFERTLQMLRHLPEMGILLQVERDLPQLIQQVYVGKGTGLFAQQEQESWQKAESRLRSALSAFAQTAKSTYQSHLFAQDALQGLRLVDMCSEVFDVIVMNPPFGALSLGSKENLTKSYPFSKNDLLAIFVERALELLRPGGRVGAITSRACFFLSSFEKWRTNVALKKGEPECFADFGHGVMDDAMVEAAAYVFRKPISDPKNGAKNFPCIRALKDEDKNSALLKAVKNTDDSNYFLADIDSFEFSPGKAFTYWVPKEILEKLNKFKPIEGSQATVKVGLQTGDDWRFLRQWWEVENTAIADASKVKNDGQGSYPEKIRSIIRNQTTSGSCKWAMYSKTDYSAPWYSPLLQVVNWKNDGDHFLHFFDANGKLRSRPQNLEHYFLPGFSYMLRSFRLVPYIVPAGAVPTAGRSQVFPLGEDVLDVFAICASNLGSAVARFNGEKFAWPKFQAGMVQGIPSTKFGLSLKELLQDKVKGEVDTRRKIFQLHEPFIEFVLPAYLMNVKESLSWQKDSLLGHELELKVASAYGLSSQEFEALEKDILEAIESQSKINWSDDDSDGDESDDDSDTPESAEVIDESPRSIADGFISYLVGCSFGRWDIRIATSDWKQGGNIDPFAPISCRPPGFLRNGAATYSNNELEDIYPISVFASGVVAEDGAGSDDLVKNLEKTLRYIFNSDLDSKEQDLLSKLQFPSVRDYIKKPTGFFSDHLRRYSKSRRKAPIYWPLSTASGSYTLWVYYPSLNNQTLFTAVNDFLDGPNGKLTQVSRECAELRMKASSLSRDEVRQYETLQAFEQELIDLRDTLLKIAPTYQPNRDDGVQITAARLWPLFRHKPWQKVLKDTWTRLEKGDYDWAHLAMAYWPNRVREKCKTDKSLAIAHGLEDLYVEPEAAPKKTRGRKKVWGEE